MKKKNMWTRYLEWRRMTFRNDPFLMGVIDGITIVIAFWIPLLVILLLSGCGECGVHPRAIIRCSGTGSPGDLDGGLRTCAFTAGESIEAGRWVLPLSKCTIEWID